MEKENNMKTKVYKRLIAFRSISEAGWVQGIFLLSDILDCQVALAAAMRSSDPNFRQSADCRKLGSPAPKKNHGKDQSICF